MWTCTGGSSATCTKTKLGNKITVPLLNPGTPFDGIRLTAKNGGSFSLRGATFNLVSQADAVLDCTNPSITKGSTTATYLGAAGDACAGSVAVTLTSGADSVELLKPNDQVPDAEFVFDLVWKTRRTSTTHGALGAPDQGRLRRRSGTAPDEPTALSWCPNLVNKTVGTATYLVVNDVKD